MSLTATSLSPGGAARTDRVRGGERAGAWSIDTVRLVPVDFAGFHFDEKKAFT